MDDKDLRKEVFRRRIEAGEKAHLEHKLKELEDYISKQKIRNFNPKKFLKAVIREYKFTKKQKKLLLSLSSLEPVKIENIFLDVYEKSRTKLNEKERNNITKLVEHTQDRINFYSEGSKKVKIEIAPLFGKPFSGYQLKIELIKANF